MKRLFVFVVSSFVVLACKNKNATLGTDPNSIEAPSPSTITIANVFGTCEDPGACEKDCDAGNADQCRKLGTTYQFGNKAVTKDDKRALEYYQAACAMKNAMGCVSSGQMFEFHHGVDKDDTKAASFYRMGCDLGYQVGCANYAIMLENGRGVPVDIPRATKLYEDACKAGAGLACDRLRVLGAADASTDHGLTAH